MQNLAKKLVVVGDGMVGKTALLCSYVQGDFREDYIPTVFETTTKEVHLPRLDRTITLGLWDTGGQEEFDQIRQLAYPGANIIILCYAVDCKTSLDNISQTWHEEIRLHCPNVPIILVGCKSDKRCSCGQQPRHDEDGNLVTFVNPVEAEKVAKSIGACAHIECSARTRSNVSMTFLLAAEYMYMNEYLHELGRPVKNKLLNRFRLKTGSEASNLNGTLSGSASSFQNNFTKRFRQFLCTSTQK